jgi:hypothetical protein
MPVHPPVTRLTACLAIVGAVDIVRGEDLFARDATQAVPIWRASVSCFICRINGLHTPSTALTAPVVRTTAHHQSCRHLVRLVRGTMKDNWLALFRNRIPVATFVGGCMCWCCCLNCCRVCSGRLNTGRIRTINWMSQSFFTFICQARQPLGCGGGDVPCPESGSSAGTLSRLEWSRKP